MAGTNHVSAADDGALSITQNQSIKERAVRKNFCAKQLLFFPLLILLAGRPAQALPEFLQRFSSDPFARPERRGQCSTCHVNPQGGGDRNPFGIAFDQNNREIT